jgi:hypothetical protein
MVMTISPFIIKNRINEARAGASLNTALDDVKLRPTNKLITDQFS